MNTWDGDRRLRGEAIQLFFHAVSSLRLAYFIITTCIYLYRVRMSLFFFHVCLARNDNVGDSSENSDNAKDANIRAAALKQKGTAPE